MGTYSLYHMPKSPILSIYKSTNTVFSTKDVALLWQESDIRLVKKRLYRYAKSEKLYSIRRGFYAKDKNYNKFELATKIYTPSYISLETVLAKAGITFQLYNRTFVVSYLTREITADGQKYTFRKIKDSLLTNTAGVEQRENYAIATSERAFLDTVYLNKNYHFDNLSNLDWKKVFEILPIYNNMRVEKAVKSYQNHQSK